ncbi:Zn-ribbon domain-containing OB-fold protein [Trinickia violacea]|nr:OB-fold domain-containing protein [Trinickia violacea]
MYAATSTEAGTPAETRTHAFPCSNRDFDFYYDGLEARRLLVQKCCRCGTMRNPPGPACPACRSLEWAAFELRGTGTIFSYTVHHHPKLPNFEVPHPVVLVEMDEGIRVFAAMDGGVEPPQIGARVQVEFLRRGAVASFRFKPA